MRTAIWAGILFLAASMTGTAADWCQWRGPNQNGTAGEQNLPAALNADTQVWKTPLPSDGQATPIICDGRVYLSGYDRKAKTLLAMCLDAESGTVLWQKTAGTFEKLPRRNLIASPSPVADAAGAIFLYSNGILVKFSPEGELLWKRNLVAEYGPFKMGWTYSSSPLLYDGRLYVQVLRSREAPDGYTGPMASYLLGVNPATGKNLFKVDRPTEASGDFTDAYTTPIPAAIDGQTQILLYGGNYLTAHDPETGKELWRYGYVDRDEDWGRAVATPIVNDGRIYCFYPTGPKAFACDLSKLAAGEAARLWNYEKRANDVPGAVLYKGGLYLIEDGEKTLTCLNPDTGAVYWIGQLDKSDMYFASLTAGDDKLYAVNRRGVVTVIAADTTEFRILSTQTFAEIPVEATIAVANGKIYLRTARHLYCFAKPQ